MFGNFYFFQSHEKATTNYCLCIHSLIYLNLCAPFELILVKKKKYTSEQLDWILSVGLDIYYNKHGHSGSF